MGRHQSISSIGQRWSRPLLLRLEDLHQLDRSDVVVAVIDGVILDADIREHLVPTIAPDHR